MAHQADRHPLKVKCCSSGHLWVKKNHRKCVAELKRETSRGFERCAWNTEWKYPTVVRQPNHITTLTCHLTSNLHVICKRCCHFSLIQAEDERRKKLQQKLSLVWTPQLGGGNAALQAHLGTSENNWEQLGSCLFCVWWRLWEWNKLVVVLCLLLHSLLSGFTQAIRLCLDLTSGVISRRRVRPFESLHTQPRHITESETWWIIQALAAFVPWRQLLTTSLTSDHPVTLKGINMINLSIYNTTQNDKNLQRMAFYCMFHREMNDFCLFHESGAFK